MLAPHPKRGCPEGQAPLTQGLGSRWTPNPELQTQCFQHKSQKNVIPGFTHASPCNAEEAIPPIGTDPTAGMRLGTHILDASPSIPATEKQ